MAQPGSRTSARARAGRRAGFAFALDRDHRQPCFHAGASRRRRAARGDGGAGDAGRRRWSRSARAHRRDRRREPVADRRKARHQCGRARRARGPRGPFPKCRATGFPALHLAKGNYFLLAMRSPFSRLIYPMPAEGGLGVHLRPRPRGANALRRRRRMDRGDRLRRRSETRRELLSRHSNVLARIARRLAAAGLFRHQAKNARPGGSNTDFVIQTEKDHGVAGLINLFGIESPGLTASLAIAEWISRLI